MDLQLGMGGRRVEGGGDLRLLMLGRLEQHPAGLWWESFMPGAGRGRDPSAGVPRGPASASAAAVLLFALFPSDVIF